MNSELNVNNYSYHTHGQSTLLELHICVYVYTTAKPLMEIVLVQMSFVDQGSKERVIFYFHPQRDIKNFKKWQVFIMVFGYRPFLYCGLKINEPLGLKK